jgi:hypothetical protein
MSEEKGDAIGNERETPTSKSLGNLRPWKPGQSGNPAGRPKIEPRVRKYARRYDRRAVKELFRIGTDPKAPHDTRRRALMDLIAVGSGRPALVQEVSGRDGQPVGPLVSLNFGAQPGQPLSPEQAYRMMVEGTIEADPSHPAFEQQRPVIEAKAEQSQADK